MNSGLRNLALREKSGRFLARGREKREKGTDLALEVMTKKGEYLREEGPRR